MSDRLKTGERLAPWSMITSQNGKYVLVLQGDGNLVMYRAGVAVWSTNTFGKIPQAVMQTDGNFVLYDNKGKPVWASNTAGHPGAWLILQNDRNLVIYGANGHPLWSSVTVANEQTGIDDYIKPYFNESLNLIGFRVGTPIISHEVGKIPGYSLSDTRYNKIYAHNIHLNGYASDGLKIGIPVRWEQFEKIPTTDRVWKRGEVNCNGEVLIRLAVSPDHRVVYRGPPLVTGADCSSSGIGPQQILDHFVEGLTWIASGGKDKFGFFDILAGFGALGYDFGAFFSEVDVPLGDAIEKRVLTERLANFVRGIYQLDHAQKDVFLKDIWYDSMGVWFIFSYPKLLGDAVKKIVDTIRNPGQSWQFAATAPHAAA